MHGRSIRCAPTPSKTATDAQRAIKSTRSFTDAVQRHAWRWPHCPAGRASTASPLPSDITARSSVARNALDQAHVRPCRDRPSRHARTVMAVEALGDLAPARLGVAGRPAQAEGPGERSTDTFEGSSSSSSHGPGMTPYRSARITRCPFAARRRYPGSSTAPLACSRGRRAHHGSCGLRSPRGPCPSR